MIKGGSFTQEPERNAQDLGEKNPTRKCLRKLQLRLDHAIWGEKGNGNQNIQNVIRTAFNMVNFRVRKLGFEMASPLPGSVSLGYCCFEL